MGESPVSRRTFVEAGLGLAVWAPAHSTAAPAIPPEPAPSAAASVKARTFLKEPGPMVPPVPAILLTVNGQAGEPDEISVVWTFVIEGKPPQVGIAPGNHHRAQALVERHREFVLNVPVVSMVEAFDKVDFSSTKVADKFALTGWTRGRAAKVDAPTIDEAPIQVECRVFESVSARPARKVFLADVVATSVHQGVCDAEGRLIVEAVPFFGMTAGSGEFYTMGRRVGHIGQGVGRSDIKY
jgi:flavin reductase (DIM6/NTAB) family NADH-FMN oxidoreductase RutF